MFDYSKIAHREYLDIVRAEFDYTAADETELTFAEGDRLVVVHKAPLEGDAWWSGRPEGMPESTPALLFPSEYVVVVKSADEQRAEDAAQYRAAEAAMAKRKVRETAERDAKRLSAVIDEGGEGDEEKEDAGTTRAEAASMGHLGARGSVVAEMLSSTVIDGVEIAEESVGDLLQVRGFIYRYILCELFPPLTSSWSRDLPCCRIFGRCSSSTSKTSSKWRFYTGSCIACRISSCTTSSTPSSRRR